MIERNQEEWQLGATAPVLYQRYLVPAMTAAWAADLADRAALQRGERVLDVACGTGVVARLAAERVTSTGRVAALDVNPGMLSVARSLPPVSGAPIEWHEGSVLGLPFPAGAFDVVLCQLGLQFFPDRPGSLNEIRRVLVRGGRLALNVFAAIEHSPATHALANALDRQIGADASVAKRTEHALADREELRELVWAAGFRDVVIRSATKMVRFPSAGEYVRIQLAATPLASLMAPFDATRRESLMAALTEEVGRTLSSYTGKEGLTFPQEVHIVLAGTPPKL
jgi:ubiquinone/menaquinone biosynthesis C-methylase UbiE